MLLKLIRNHYLMMKNTRAHTNWNKCFIWHFHFWCWCSEVNAGVPSPCPAWTIRSLMLCSRSSILPAISSIREIIYKSCELFRKTMNSSSISRKNNYLIAHCLESVLHLLKHTLNVICQLLNIFWLLKFLWLLGLSHFVLFCILFYYTGHFLVGFVRHVSSVKYW